MFWVLFFFFTSVTLLLEYAVEWSLIWAGTKTSLKGQRDIHVCSVTLGKVELESHTACVHCVHCPSGNTDFHSPAPWPRPAGTWLKLCASPESKGGKSCRAPRGGDCCTTHRKVKLKVFRAHHLFKYLTLLLFSFFSSDWHQKALWEKTITRKWTDKAYAKMEFPSNVNYQYRTALWLGRFGKSLTRLHIEGYISY